MKSIIRRLRAGRRSAILSDLKALLEIHAGKWPALYFGLYRLVRKNWTHAVSPTTQLVIEGFPRSANTFAVVAFRKAQKQEVRIAHHFHVPAQVIRAVRWRIPTLVLIREPRDAVLSLTIREPVSVDLALMRYISFYGTIARYRDAYVLGRFEEVTSDYGKIIERVNAKFGTSFSLFRHNKKNVSRVLARIDRTYERRRGTTSRETEISRPSDIREQMKRELEHELEDPKRKRLIAEAEAIYVRLTAPTRGFVEGK